MAFTKENPTPGPGRPKGSKNRLSLAVRDMVEEALEGVGGVEYLKTQAIANPNAFLSLIAKLMPTELSGSLSVIHEDALASLERNTTTLGEGAQTTH